jgi:hypothetical protein
MPANKIAISISEDALRLVDRYAAEEGLSRSAWFERAVQGARRRAGVAEALRQARQAGIRTADERSLERLRNELRAK